MAHNLSRVPGDGQNPCATDELCEGTALDFIPNQGKQAEEENNHQASSLRPQFPHRAQQSSVPDWSPPHTCPLSGKVACVFAATTWQIVELQA